MTRGHHENISAETKLFKKNLATLVEFSTEMALKFELKLKGTTTIKSLTNQEKLKLP